MFLTNGYKKGEAFASPTSCGGLTRTDDLWVMSPTSYQLLHSAMLFLDFECKGTAFFYMCKLLGNIFSKKMHKRTQR